VTDLATVMGHSR